MSLNILANDNTFPKDIVSDNFGTNDTSNNTSRVNAYSHIEIFELLILYLVSELFDDIHHLKACPDDLVDFIYDDVSYSSTFAHATIISH